MCSGIRGEALLRGAFWVVLAGRCLDTVGCAPKVDPHDGVGRGVITAPEMGHAIHLQHHLIPSAHLVDGVCGGGRGTRRNRG